jgi:hypothetical protein
MLAAAISVEESRVSPSAIRVFLEASRRAVADAPLAAMPHVPMWIPELSAPVVARAVVGEAVSEDGDGLLLLP